MIRQVSCYTLLSGFRLPWPPSCCLYQPTPFVVSHERALGTLTARLVHPTAPVLLTKNGPLGTLCSSTRPRSGRVAPLTHLKFESRLRTFRPQCLQSFALPDKTIYPSASYPEGNFGGNQLLGGSISLSPLCSSLTTDLHVRIAASLHQSFLWLRPAQA